MGRRGTTAAGVVLALLDSEGDHEAEHAVDFELRLDDPADPALVLGQAVRGAQDAVRLSPWP